MKVTELLLDGVLVLGADAGALSGSERRLALDSLSAGDRARLPAMSDGRADAFLAGRLLVRRGLEHPALGAARPPTTTLRLERPPTTTLRLERPPTTTLEMGFSLRDGLQPIPKRETHPELAVREQARGFDAPRSAAQPGVLEVVCSHCGSTGHGKPLVPGLPVLTSITYAGTAVFVALASTDLCSRLGIDAEALGRHAAQPGLPSGGPSPRAASGADPEPARDLERWTAVEAVVKADGRGLRVDPGEVEFDGGALARVAGDNDAYRICRTVVDDRFILTLATRSSTGAR
ncbi:hypothetical protein [Pseudoclavibacter helvolus]|uniref:hypothetical protein n=1 Tax=Pseudoclavibacter helvolus TaxID=255205 RepID=UPI003C78549A